MNMRALAARSILALTVATGFAGAAIATTHANPLADLSVKRLTAVNGHERIRVANLTFGGPSAKFRIAVLAGADSYSIYSAPIGGGGWRDFDITPLGCGQPVAILVDLEHTNADPNFANNHLGFTSVASC